MKRVGICPGQITLDELFSLFERIVSLAKEKGCVPEGWTAERLFSVSVPNGYTYKDFLKPFAHVIRTLLRKVEGDPGKDETVKSIKEIMDNVSFELLTYEGLSKSYPDLVKRSVRARELVRSPKPNEEVYYLVCDEVWPELVLVGLKNGTPRYDNSVFYDSEVLKGVDMGIALGYLFLYSLFKRQLENPEELRKTVRFKELKELVSKRGYKGFGGKERFLMPEGKKIIFSSKRGGILNDYYWFIKPWLEKSGNELINYDNLSRQEQTALFCEHFRGIPTTDFEELSECEQKDDAVILLHGLDVPGLLIRAFCDGADGIVPYLIEGSNRFNRVLQLRRIKLGYQRFALPDLAYNFSVRTAATDLFAFSMYLGLTGCKLVERKMQKRAEQKKEREGYAKSFQTKRNIPQKTLDAMEKSILKQYFHFVEYDEDTDLLKVKVVEEEIRQFLETHLSDHLEKLTEVDLRYRRLGNHRASGLYYPFFRTLCVDIHTPASFVHEMGHCIDYTNGELSNRLFHKEFATLYNRYEHAFDRKVYRNGATLKGKYDRSYYLKETEVFARSFELYMAYVVGLEGSILDTKDGYAASCAYPVEDSAYMAEVNNYFDRLFNGTLEQVV